MIIDNISSFMYSKLLVIILIGAGVYFTIRTSFPQVRLFHSACKAVMEKRPCSGISQGRADGSNGDHQYSGDPHSV